MNNRTYKRLICVVLCAVITLALVGCAATTEPIEETHIDGSTKYTKVMSVVFRDGDCWIYRHNETGVYYLSYRGAGVTVMLNADGTPYTGGYYD